MKPNIELSDQNRKEIADLLNTLLADEYVLFTKTRKAHWNIQGQNFMELHKFFEGQYEVLDEIIDEVAERVRALGQLSIGSLKEFAKVTNLLEDDRDLSSQKHTIETLTHDHEIIIRTIRTSIVPVSEKCTDLGTTDFVTGVMEQHEKMAWMLRAYIS